MKLTRDQRIALHNLADKEAGQSVGWINISDAQTLTDLGLARRNRGGWEITLEGAALIENQARPAETGSLVPFLRPIGV